MQLKLVGIDLAKSVFQIAGLNDQGKITFNRKISRAKLIQWLQNSPATEVVMESCGTSNYWARLAQRCPATACQRGQAVSPRQQERCQRCYRHH